jgi:hypothetical protein
MSSHEPSEPTAGIPLKASVDELRRRREAVGRLQGGSTYYEEELGIFRDYAAESGFFLPHPPPKLSRAPDEEGNEHQVWFERESCTYLKATWPDFFGLQVMHRHDEDAKASPIAYLERWFLHNELFGDQVEFLGALETDGQMRLLIRQPAIRGIPATVEQIEEFFTGNGWRRFSAGGEVAFFDPERNVAVSDTHRGNLILMDNGLLAPIDLRVQALSGALIDTVTKLCST